MSKDQFCTSGTDIGLFDKGRIVGMYLSEKTSKEISEAIKIDLSTVQRVILNWKNNDEPVFTKRNGDLKKILNRKSKKAVTTVKLKAMFHRRRKNVSTSTMRRELERLGLKHCVVVIKPLIMDKASEISESVNCSQQETSLLDKPEVINEPQVNMTAADALPEASEQRELQPPQHHTEKVPEMGKRRDDSLGLYSLVFHRVTRT